MPIETIASVGKSDPSFDLQADISFDGNGGAKINKKNQTHTIRNMFDSLAHLDTSVLKDSSAFI